MHNLVADPTDTFAAARSSAITEGFPHHVDKMASRLKCTLCRESAQSST